MQPNEPQDLQRPGQGLPVQPVQPMQPAQPVQPATQPLSPVVSPAPNPPAAIIDSATLQSALNDPPQVAAPEPALDTPQLQAVDQVPVGEDDDQNQSGNEEFEGDVTWTANEYLHQEKGTKWLALFIAVCLGFVGLSVWMRAWSFTAVIVVIAFIVIVYLRRPPRELAYSLTEEGLTVDDKLHKYEEFKSFGVIEDGEEYSVMLIPTQRFQPSVTVYFPEEVGDDIVDVLGERLPMKDLKLDAIDRLVRMLRL